MRRTWVVVAAIALVMMYASPAAAPMLERRPLHVMPANIEIPQPEPVVVELVVEATAYIFPTRDEALAWGRRTVQAKVVFEDGNHDG